MAGMSAWGRTNPGQCHSTGRPVMGNQRAGRRPDGLRRASGVGRGGRAITVRQPGV